MSQDNYRVVWYAKDDSEHIELGEFDDLREAEAALPALREELKLTASTYGYYNGRRFVGLAEIDAGTFSVSM